MKENRVIAPFRITESHSSRPLAEQKSDLTTGNRPRNHFATNLTRAHWTENGVGGKTHGSHSTII